MDYNSCQKLVNQRYISYKEFEEILKEIGPSKWFIKEILILIYFKGLKVLDAIEVVSPPRTIRAIQFIINRLSDGINLGKFTLRDLRISYLLNNPQLMYNKYKSDRKKNALKRGKEISKKVRWEVLKRDSFKCTLCGNDAQLSKLHIDHIFPKSKGGTNEMVNLQVLCFKCNSGKSNSSKTFKN